MWMTIAQARAVAADRPFLHRTTDGAPKDGGTNRAIAERFISELSKMKKPRILETGTGVSTLLFLSLDPGSVISISPAADLHERTRAEAASRGIDIGPARFVDDRSERALPLLALVEEAKIDAGFIDGDHGWPAVFVDFCYMNLMLNRGGLLFVDDIQIYSVAQLVCLLRQQQSHYEFLGIDSKMATFRKTGNKGFLPDHRFEPFITANTATSGRQP
jgi:predicted O-methyltransferase YrrM